MSKTSFLLTKWYLDCVSDTGDTVILYSADLRWNTLSFRYGSILTALGGKVGSRSSLHGITLPVLDGQSISVNQPGLDLQGRWEALRNPIRKVVLQNPQGAIDWHCFQPMAHVDLQLLGKIRVTGLGYAECLTVSILPWQLPLKQLNWGRYLSQNDAVVWIDWQGEAHTQSLLHNGQEHSGGVITESQVVFDDSSKRLELDRGLVLRDGKLGDTVFPGVSRLAQILPRTMLSVHECKWRSRGVLRTPDGENSGWAIHEVVRWRD